MTHVAPRARPASASSVPARTSPWTIVTPAPCSEAASDSAIPAPNQSSVAMPLMLANGRMATGPVSGAPASCAAAPSGAELAESRSRVAAPMLVSLAIPCSLLPSTKRPNLNADARPCRVAHATRKLLAPPDPSQAPCPAPAPTAPGACAAELHCVAFCGASSWRRQTRRRLRVRPQPPPPQELAPRNSTALLSAAQAPGAARPVAGSVSGPSPHPPQELAPRNSTALLSAAQAPRSGTAASA